LIFKWIFYLNADFGSLCLCITFQTELYKICLRTCDDGMDGSEVFPEFPAIIADKYVHNLVIEHVFYNRKVKLLE